ncbi:hypothetical protein [Alkalihalobacterium elongatum]|uniref:hypothetical protein n=1 Tax=Alkalihalobacterium elongatum TaxID=2675466 RepID=UPI001C20024D|nr:hypothetical protein [Alkalihalobacterium elongatum]
MGILQELKKIGCFGWVVIFLIFLFILSAINSSQDARQLEQEQLERELQEQERLERVERQQIEKEKRKKEEDETKVKLTSDMIHNEPGETTDIYGIELTVSKPYETVLDIDNESHDTVKRIAQKRSKVLTFDVTVKNHTEETISLSRIKLTRPAYTIPREYEFDRTYRYSSAAMDRYFRGNSFSTRDPIAPGEERTGQISFFIDDSYLSSSKRGRERGSQNFEFTIDVSGIPFLHSFEDNIIKYKLVIDRDTFQ